MIKSLLKLYKGFKYKFIANIFHQLSLSLFNLVFSGVFRLISTFKSVNQRVLSTLTTTLVLSAFLTACGGGGGGGSSDSTDTPAPAGSSPSLSLSVSSSALTLSEDFSPVLTIATAANATDIRVSQSITGVVNVTTSVTSVSVSSILNANGRTTLTITASSGTLSTETQVVVQVTAVNDPPTLRVSTDNISVNVGFSTITINTTASDVEEGVLPFTVQASNAGVVRVTTSANAIFLNAIPAVSGRTTLSVSVIDGSGSIVTQTIAVNVTAAGSAAPVLMVSTNRISVKEDFGSVVIRTTVTESDSTTLTLAVTTSMRLVNVAISTRTNNLSTITLTAIAHLNGTATLTVRATDVDGQSTEVDIVVVVASVNDTPTLTVPTTTLTVLEDFDGTNLVATFADVDSGDALSVTVTESSTGIVTVTTSASGVSVAAIAHRNGRTTLNMSVSDGTLSSTAQVVVDVTPVNDPPALSVSTNALTLAEDFGTFLIATTRTDIDSTTLTFTVVESASGIVSVSTSSAGVQLRSTDNISGVTTLAITVSDGFLSSTAQVVVTVTAVNDTPVLTVSTTALTLDEDFATTQLITVNRSDIENNTLTLSVAESISNIVRVSTSTAGVQVVSIGDANGQTTLTITVSDGQTSASTQVVVTVNAVNDTPTLTVSSNSISTLDGFSPITINTTASDIEDANISFAVINANTEVVTVTTSAEAIVLNTIPGASGQTTLTVRVVDSSGTTITEVITVSVTIRPKIAAPVVTVSTNLISVQEDFGTSVMIQTTATDADAADTITVSVSASMPIVTAVISTPVSGQSTITNSITITAIDDANGTATLTVVARNPGGQSHSIEIVVVVAPVQDAPTLNIPTATLTVAEDFGSTLTIATANDDDGDTLLISVIESTTGIVTVTTSASGVSVSSLLNANGQTTLTITVNDGNQDTTGQVVVNVTPINDPPSLNIPSATITAIEDFVGGISIATASDIDSTILTITVAESTTGVIRVTASSSDVRISSLGEANGITTLVISLSDGDLTTTAQVVVTVTPVNDPPTLSVTTTALTLNEDFATVLIGTTRSDIDSNTLTLTVAESATGVVTVTITDAGVQVANNTDTNGVTTLTISLSDGELTVTTQVVVTVTPVNDPPSLSVSTIALTLNEDFSTTEVITVSRNDIDSNTLTLTVSESSSGVVTVTTIDAGVQVANIANANGRTTLTIRVSDGDGGLASSDVVVVVNAVEDTPTLSVSTTNITASAGFSTITINTTANDADEGALSFTVSAVPTGVVTVTTSTNTIMMNAIAGASGETTLTVRTADSLGTTVTQTIAVNVINSAPVLTVSTSLISVQEDFMTSFMFSIIATDIDGDAITLSVSSTTRLVDAALSTQINGQSTITLTAIDHENGTTTLIVQATAAGQSVSTNVVVVVVPVNDTPTLTVSSNSITTFGGFSTIIINTTANDIEDRTLSFTVTESTANVVTVTTSANAIALNAISGATGQTTLTVRTADNLGTTVTQTIAVNVINSAPVLAISTSLISLQEDFMTSVMFSITATDIDGDTITLSVRSTTRLVDAALSTLTNGVSTVTLTAIDHENGTTTLILQATAAGQSVSTNVVVVVVPVNDTPTLTVSTNSITTVGGFSTIIINTTASDIEDSTLSFTVAESTTGVFRVTTSVNAITLNSIFGVTGQTTLTVRTADNLGTTVTQTIAVNVINSAPVLTVSTRLISLQEDFMTSVSFSITATDIDGDTITLSVSSITRLVDAALSTLTNGVSTVTLTAIDHENGTTTLIVQATAAGQSVSTNVVVVVVPVNDTPTLTVTTNSITTFGGFSTITINTTAKDIEDSTLSFTVSAFPTGVVSVSTSANAITLNAISGATGQTTLTVGTIDRSGTTVTQTISVNVINSAPVLTVSTILVSVQEDFMTSVSFSITATDIDGDTITLSVSSSSRVVNVALSTPISGQSTITLTAIDHENGTTTLIVQATDAGQSVSTNVVVVVAPVNDTPTLTVSSNSITTLGGFSTITINTTASDIEDSTLTFTVTASTANVVRVTTSANAILLNAISGGTSQTILTVRTADRSGTTVTQTIAVNVIKSAPVLTVSTDYILVQEDFMPSVMFGITATDIDGDTITLSVSSSSRVVNATISTMTNGMSTITLTAIDHENGTTTLIVQATADGQSVSTNVLVVVFSVDDPPTLTVSSNSITTLGGFSTITINTTANDVDEGALSFTVSAFPTGVVTVTTSANAILLNAISGATGLTTLTVITTDTTDRADIQIIAVNVINSAPVLKVSTSLISVQEDFNGSVVIRTTATDIDGHTMTLSVSSTSRFVNVAISTPINGRSNLTNSITLTAINNANGTTILTVQATDARGFATTEQIVVVVNAVDDGIPIGLSTSAVSLSVPGSQLDRIINTIRVSNPDNKALRAQIQVTTSGDNIFSANPTPVASFTTNTLTTTTTLISAVSTAQLYFTIAPNSIGTGTLVIQLTDLDTALMTQQTMVVSVNSPNVPPTIVPASSSITNLVVYGGHLYANDTMPPIVGISRYLTTARALGGHLINFNSVEEYNFVLSATSGLLFAEAWLGLVLPQRTLVGGGELSWITHDSTIAYGYATANGVGNLTVYPGHYNLNWDPARGLVANRVPQSPTTTVFNWTIRATNEPVFFLVDDIGDGPRGVMYEFPQGLPTIASHSTSIRVVTNASVRLTGYDLNGDAINTNNWSITDPNGGSAIFNNVSQRSGAQTVDMVYTPRPNFDGQTTVAVTLQINGLSTTYPISFIVDGPPTIALSTNAITLNEDFGTFDIGTTATDQGVSTSLPFSVSASRSGIVTISTSVNNIQLSAVQHANGPVTLTVQSIDSASQSISALIVVNVQAVNDTPTLTFSTNSISILGGVSIFTIDTTATDVEDGPLSFSLHSSTTGMLSITTSTNAIVLDTIYNASVQSTLTVTVVDTLNTTVVQTIAVNVIITPSATPVLTLSTNLMKVDEDFSSPVVIRTTATDAEGDALIVSISSSSHLVNAVLSSPINGVSTITNSITLTSMADLNGTTTLTVRATDGGGISVTEQIVVVVNPVDDAIPFTLSTSAVSLSVPGSQLDRIVQSINISNPSNKTLSAQLQVTSSGDPIFSANPTPVVSFTTNALTTLTTLTSTMPTAQLYFTIAPNQTGTATLTVHLTNLDDSAISQQTLVVQVIPVNVPPAIVPTVSSITNLVVRGGRLYANSVQNVQSLNPLLTEARALGGQLINFNSDEEYQLILGSAVVTHNTWWGLVLPQQAFPGELSWITHDSTIAYGFATSNGEANLTVYPGQYPLPWNTGGGVTANRSGNATAINGTVYSDSAFLFLLQEEGDGGSRIGLYEFPQGMTPTTINPIPLISGTNALISLTGFDLNGDAINTNDWSITDPNGGSATFNTVSQNSGVQMVTMIYTAPANFSGQTTVAVTLQVNGLSSTYPISFMVDGPPTIALSTNAITLAEDFGNFVIGTTVTDQGVSGSLPFSVQTNSTGIVNLSTTINSIHFSGALNFNGTVTLTVQATDSIAQTASTLVVVTVQAVNDTPTVTVSTNNISILGGFFPITIDTTATDIEQGALPFTVLASTQGVVSIRTNSNAIVLSPIVGGSGRTTLTVSANDDGSKTSIQTIAVNVIVIPSTTPVLSVSTNLISLQEDFGSVVIGTTATDVESGTLVVTVSSTTHLVNMVISTHSIALSSVANLFGTTTLTVRARDVGGVFVSTELVVIVASVNDTPTLSVSSNTVNLRSTSLLLDVTASDVEDGVLSFGTSTGQGFVNIAITTTRLTLTRLNQSGQVLLTLTSTDTEGVTDSTVVRVTIPTFFDVTTGIKTLDFAWSLVSSATHYQLQSNPDGNSGFPDLSTTGIVVSPNSTDIKQTTAQGLVSLHRYIPNVTNPQYGVKTCDATSCGTSFRHNTVSLTKAQLNSMIGRLQASNPDSGDLFGYSVDLSGDGNTLAVGAYDEHGSSTGVNGAQNNNSGDSGAVYLYRRMGGAWSQQAYIKASNSSFNDQFGFSVSLNDDGNILAVGANLEDGPATGVNGTQNDGTYESGAVYVFRFSSSTWSQQAYIKASNTGTNDQFGYAVAISGDGNTLAVGARSEGSSSRGINNIQTDNRAGIESGAAYLFRFDGGMWSQQAYIKASNSYNSDRFGHSVSLNKDGNTLTVGAYREDSIGSGVNGDQTTRAPVGNFEAGAVYLFRFSTASSVWSQQAYIKALNVFETAQFGWSVDLNDDGNTLAVGANQDPSNSTGVNGAQNEVRRSRIGAAYIFRFNKAANTWSQQAFIKASNAGQIDFFGTSVSISGDGNALVVGAFGEAGSATGVEGINDIYNPILDSGAAYVFEFANGTWAQQAFIKASDTSPDARFGQSVSISNDGGAIAVGAWGVNTNTGAVYLY